jgi:dsRNA-specific ribonuclease
MHEIVIHNGDDDIFDTHPKICSDVFESTIGALFVDLGLSQTMGTFDVYGDFIRRFLIDPIGSAMEELIDHKGQFQAWVNSSYRNVLPEYKVLDHINE